MIFEAVQAVDRALTRATANQAEAEILARLKSIQMALDWAIDGYEGHVEGFEVMLDNIKNQHPRRNGGR